MLQDRHYFTLDGERATRIEGYRYAITESGRVWKFWNEEQGKEQEPKVWLKDGKEYTRKPKFIDIIIPVRGYSKVTLRDEPKLRTDVKPWPVEAQNIIRGCKEFLIHVLVAKYFIPNHNNYKFVEHINRNKNNNHCTNLRWASEDPNMLGYYKD